jgi:SAM-dependent MidA family methyltransferase
MLHGIPSQCAKGVGIVAEPDDHAAILPAKRFRHNGGLGPTSPLLPIVREEIQSSGPITFARFMDLALYHPQHGYYRSADRFGVRGDFYTAEQLQPVFGEVIAHFVEKLTKEQQWDETFGILELGAGRAEMADALARWRYCAVDWNFSPLPSEWRGLIFANEFFDALPVHLLVKRHDWKELYVNCNSGALYFSEGDLSQPDLRAYVQAYGANIADGGLLEACLAVDDWYRRLSTILLDGDLLVIDYGYRCRELLRFPQGTVLGYTHHRASASVLSNPGERDITAHVNFDWLRVCAERAGFHFRNSYTLATWLLSVWNEEELARRWSKADARWQLQWKQLLFGLGETFTVVRFSNKKRP